MAKKKGERKAGALLPPKNDFVFKLLFGEEKSKNILTSFLKAVLDISDQEFDTLTIVDPHLRKEYEGDKLGILDVKIKTTSGSLLNIEIQVESSTLMRKRVEFYNAKMVTEQIGASEEYSSIKRAINIVITDFVLVPDSQAYHHCFVRYDPKNRVQFSDVTEIHTLELPKLPRESDDTFLWDWLFFLASDQKEDFEMIAEKNADVKDAYMKLEVLSQSEKNRRLYEAREKQRMDNLMYMNEARKQGLEQGLEQGKQLSKKVFASYMEKKSPEEIAKACDISVEEVLAILP